MRHKQALTPVNEILASIKAKSRAKLRDVNVFLRSLGNRLLSLIFWTYEIK